MKKQTYSAPRKPANAFLATAGRTSIRVSLQTSDAVERVQCQLTEWMLAHPDPDVRSEALRLTADRVLRVVLATFARDYGIPLLQESP